MCLQSFQKLRLTLVQPRSGQRGRRDWKAGWDVKGYFSIVSRYHCWASVRVQLLCCQLDMSYFSLIFGICCKLLVTCNFCNSYFTYLPEVTNWCNHLEILAFVSLSGCTWSPWVFLLSVEILVLCDLSIRGHCLIALAVSFVGRSSCSWYRFSLPGG